MYTLKILRSDRPIVGMDEDVREWAINLLACVLKRNGKPDPTEPHLDEYLAGNSAEDRIRFWEQLTRWLTGLLVIDHPKPTPLRVALTCEVERVKQAWQKFWPGTSWREE